MGIDEDGEMEALNFLLNLQRVDVEIRPFYFLKSLRIRLAREVSETSRWKGLNFLSKSRKNTFYYPFKKTRLYISIKVHTTSRYIYYHQHEHREKSATFLHPICSTNYKHLVMFCEPTQSRCCLMTHLINFRVFFFRNTLLKLGRETELQEPAPTN